MARCMKMAKIDSKMVQIGSKMVQIKPFFNVFIIFIVCFDSKGQIYRYILIKNDISTIFFVSFVPQ